MKDWVKPYVVEKHGLKGRLNRTLSDREAEYHLAALLQVDFVKGVEGDSQFLMEAFGSALADLPEDVFVKLKKMEHLLFVFAPNLDAEVKHFCLNNIIKEKSIIVITFPFFVAYWSPLVVRGTIVHALARVYIENVWNTVGGDEREKEADKLAVEWGYKDEIKALDDFRKRSGALDECWKRMDVEADK